MFGSAAVLGGVDGGGKGTIVATMILSFISGRPLLGEKVWRAGPVAVITYEDDEDEWRRRLTAACIHYQLDYTLMLSQVHFLHTTDGPITFAEKIEHRIVSPDGESLRDRIKEIGAVLLIVDPFNHAHHLEDGNNNAEMARVAAELTGVARDTDAAVLVLHHLRKGSTGAADDLMGATSLRATFRSCRILAPMTQQSAEQMNIADPWRYKRIAGSKENYAPPPETSTWIKLVSVEFGNGTPAYPEGDSTGVATIWRPRGMFHGMDAAALAAVFRVLRERPHTTAKQAKNTPWAGTPLMELGGRSDKEAGSIIDAWLKSGVLIRSQYTLNKNRVTKVDVNETKAAAILGDLEAGNVPLD